jgi:hypothetical protein
MPRTGSVTTEVAQDLNIPDSPPPPYPSESSVLDDPYGDTKRTLARYKRALDELKEALKKARGNWKAFQFPELEALPENADFSTIRQAINKVFEAREASVKNPSRWARCKRVVEIVYTAVSPFLRNVLALETDPSGVQRHRIQCTNILCSQIHMEYYVRDFWS